MILSDQDIKKALADGSIKISPKPDLEKQLGSCSLDLHLGNSFRVFDHARYPFIDLKNPHPEEITTEVKKKDSEYFILQPTDFVLATTKETIELADDLVGILTGRSSLGRLGIVVHSTASIFDPGFRGVCVLELGNLGRMPVALYPGIIICAMIFEKLSSKAKIPYYKKKSAKYLNQKSSINVTVS